MKRLVIATMVAAAMLFAPKAEAAIIIDFQQTISGGTVKDLGNGHWSGSGIIINGLNAINTPLNATPQGGTPWAVGGSNGGYASLDFNTQTNFITITGYVAGLGVGGPGNNVTLLSGSFTAFPVTPFVGGISITNATGPDTKNRALLLALGLPADQAFQFFGFSLAFSPQGGPAGTYTAFSTDMSNTAVPEPGSMVLLGSGLLGLAAVARRRMKKA